MAGLGVDWECMIVLSRWVKWESIFNNRDWSGNRVQILSLMPTGHQPDPKDPRKRMAGKLSISTLQHGPLWSFFQTEMVPSMTWLGLKSEMVLWTKVYDPQAKLLLLGLPSVH